jgi:hypothetical protein
MEMIMDDLKKDKAEENKDEFKYPASEDIYNQAKETNIDAEAYLEKGILQPKKNENEQTEHLPGDDLIVPGADLDNDQEKIGSEDEENNYYSLGGDNHEN